MVKTIDQTSDRTFTYQEALEDFGIAELLSYLGNYTDADFSAAKMNLEQQELESLAAILIQRLTQNLKGKLIASYLNVIRHGDSDVVCDPIPLEIAAASINLPVTLVSCYQEGDRVKWRSPDNPTDWGIVIGRFFTYAQHLNQWAVRYLIRLDEDSPSATWLVADTAWEDDLEPIEMEIEEVFSSSNPEVEQEFYFPISFTTETDFFAKSLHTTEGNYHPGGSKSSKPRTLTKREHDLINLYSHCQLGMTPQQFYAKWEVTYDVIALICSRSISTVRCWFRRGSNYRRPRPNDLRHLAFMDFLFEHFEEIPQEIVNLLCPSRATWEKSIMRSPNFS